MELVPPAYIRQLIEGEGHTLEETAAILQQGYGKVKGFSKATVKAFCQRHDIHRNRPVSNTALDEAVAAAVNQVGPVYGRRTMKGYLESVGAPSAGDRRIGQSLNRVAPLYQQLRQEGTSRLLNPKTYHAEYSGANLHIDQNEKIAQQFGVTYVIALDGLSFFVTAACAMPVKNNVVIYDRIFRETVLKFGLFYQIIVDGGLEFNLTLAMQELLAEHRTNKTRDPFRRVPSTENNRVERFWSELNSRVTFPIKAALIEMCDGGLISTNNPWDMVCVATVAGKVAACGLKLCVDAWNCHSVQGKGKPIDVLASHNFAARIPESLVPDSASALDLYRNAGGVLNDASDFGIDPLAGQDAACHERLRRWEAAVPSVADVFGSVANNNYPPFQNCVMEFIEITEQLI